MPKSSLCKWVIANAVLSILLATVIALIVFDIWKDINIREYDETIRHKDTIIEVMSDELRNRDMEIKNLQAENFNLKDQLNKETGDNGR